MRRPLAIAAVLALSSVASAAWPPPRPVGFGQVPRAVYGQPVRVAQPVRVVQPSAQQIYAAQLRAQQAAAAQVRAQQLRAQQAAAAQVRVQQLRAQQIAAAQALRVQQARYAQQPRYAQPVARPAAPATTPETIITRPNYEQFRTAVTDLLGRFAPANHVFIGVGRSPAPLIALMQNLRPGLAYNFPASGLRSSNPMQHYQEYVRHFEKFLPADVLRSGKTIVLVDRSVSNSGSSIAKLRDVLQTYLRSIGSPTQVRGIGFSEGAPNASYGLEWLPTTRYPVLNSLNNDAWEGVYGEFPHHAIGSVALETAVHRPEYDRVQQLLKAHIESDPVMASERARLGLN